MTKYINRKITNTGDCTPPVTDVHSCIQMELFFFCNEGTKVKACYDEDGALTLDLPTTPCSDVTSWCHGTVEVDNRRNLQIYHNN